MPGGSPGAAGRFAVSWLRPRLDRHSEYPLSVSAPASVASGVPILAGGAQARDAEPGLGRRSLWAPTGSLKTRRLERGTLCAATGRCVREDGNRRFSRLSTPLFQRTPVQARWRANLCTRILAAWSGEHGGNSIGRRAGAMVHPTRAQKGRNRPKSRRTVRRADAGGARLSAQNRRRLPRRGKSAGKMRAFVWSASCFYQPALRPKEGRARA